MAKPQLSLCKLLTQAVRSWSMMDMTRAERLPARRERRNEKTTSPLMTPDIDSYLPTQRWTLTCRPWPAFWEWTCVCLPAEHRETVSDQSGRWISSLRLSVSTGQQTAVPPCSRQVQDQEATKHLHTSGIFLLYTHVGNYFSVEPHEKQKIFWRAKPKVWTQFCIILIVFLYKMQ